MTFKPAKCLGHGWLLKNDMRGNDFICYSSGYITEKQIRQNKWQSDFRRTAIVIMCELLPWHSREKILRRRLMVLPRQGIPIVQTIQSPRRSDKKQMGMLGIRRLSCTYRCGYGRLFKVMHIFSKNVRTNIIYGIRSKSHSAIFFCVPTTRTSRK